MPSPLKSWVLVLTFQLISRLETLTVPMPVAKSQPTAAVNAGVALFEVESTPVSAGRQIAIVQLPLSAAQAVSMSPSVTSWKIQEPATALPRLELQLLLPLVPYSCAASW